MDFAVNLIRKGLAYVDDSNPEKIALEKGSPTEPGIENEFRSRSIEENLLLFEQMKNGEFKEGEKVLRAKIDMASDKYAHARPDHVSHKTCTSSPHRR